MTALLATGVTALCAWAVAPGTVGPVERAVFRFCNGWPDALRGPMWIFQTPGLLACR
jgi:undecaprenyl-diphosphatase